MRKRIGWLDSTHMPARIHLTEDEGETTLCGHKPRSEKNWTITDQIPRHILGVSRYCRVCFKDGGKTLPFISK
jgi:hypothetical protein